MDITTVILGTLGIASLVGLAWMGGYELGQSNAEPRRPTVAELVNELKPRRPKAAKNRRKMVRKAARA